MTEEQLQFCRYYNPRNQECTFVNNHLAALERELDTASISGRARNADLLNNSIDKSAIVPTLRRYETKGFFYIREVAVCGVSDLTTEYNIKLRQRRCIIDLETKLNQLSNNQVE